MRSSFGPWKDSRLVLIGDGDGLAPMWRVFADGHGRDYRSVARGERKVQYRRRCLLNPKVRYGSPIAKQDATLT